MKIDCARHDSMSACPGIELWQTTSEPFPVRTDRRPRIPLVARSALACPDEGRSEQAGGSTLRRAAVRGRDALAGSSTAVARNAVTRLTGARGDGKNRLNEMSMVHLLAHKRGETGVTCSTEADNTVDLAASGLHILDRARPAGPLPSRFRGTL